jgi:hypothetical protein
MMELIPILNSLNIKQTKENFNSLKKILEYIQNNKWKIKIHNSELDYFKTKSLFYTSPIKSF